jgi:phospholipid/cholesterol/gamma-HCH transport system permease protein
MNGQATVSFDATTSQLLCTGNWDLANLTVLQKALQKITWPKSGSLTINGHEITKIDSAGSWLLLTWTKQLESKGIQVQQQSFPEKAQQLLALVKTKMVPLSAMPTLSNPSWVARLGKLAVEQLVEFRDYLNFAGILSFEGLRILRQPAHFRFKALISAVEKTGYQALAIIGLLSFMIGVVIAYQMGFQLRNYGANVFIVDLLGLSVLREFGPLLSAIMVAGRTGSAFTAQLGIMKVNQEIDALNTMGVTPGELLLLPRLAGLFIVLPLLTMWSDIFGIMGGMLMANNMLGVTWVDFLQRFQREIPLRSLIIGLSKAPVFALIIASIGCFQGMQVEGSAESIGTKTTRSVVLGIFFIIVADAIFSIIFSKLRL